MRRNRNNYIEDGISLKINIVQDEYKNSFIIQFIQLFLMIFGLYGAIFCLISGLKIEVNAVKIYFFMAIAIGINLLTYLFKKYSLYIFIVLFGGYLYAGYVLWDKIKNGFWHLENIYIEHINTYYNSAFSQYEVGDFDPTTVITLFFIFLSILIAFFICQVILGKLPMVFMLYTTIALIILTLVVGQVPDGIPFAAYIIAVFGVLGLKSGMSLGKKHALKLKKTLNNKESLRNKKLQYGVGLKSGLFLGLSMGILFIALSLLVTPKFYLNQAKIPEIKENMQKAVLEYDATELYERFNQGYIGNVKLFPSAQSFGGLSKGKLGRVANLEYTFETALNVSITGDRDVVYLKGFAGSVYDGDSWKEFDKKTLNTFEKSTEVNNSFSPANLGSQLMDLLNATNADSEYINKAFQLDYKFQNIAIHNVDADFKSVYIPYFSSVPANKDYDIDFESYVKADKKIIDAGFDYYNVNNNILDMNWDQAFTNSINEGNKYLSDKFLGNNENEAYTNLVAYHQYELDNRKFAYDYYLQMPEQGMGRLASELSGITYEDFKMKYKDKALSSTVSYVRDFVQKDTSYSLSPGALPAGKDFIDYFLYESKVGYCTHYASSAAIIFRLLGIPARYVEGYVIKDTDYADGKKMGSVDTKYRKGSKWGTEASDVYELEIKDANAHAWVEIYVDGFGWVPVEMTPGYTEKEVIQSEEITKDLIENKPTIAPTNLPTQAVDEESGIEDKPVNHSDDQISNENKINQVFTRICLGIAIFIILSSLIIAREVLIRKSRIRKVAFKNTSGKAIFYYVLLKRMLKYYDIESEDEDCTKVAGQITEKLETVTSLEFINYLELIRKAKFSSNIISINELEYVRNFYFRLLSSLYLNKPWYKKLYYKYIKVF